MSKTSQKIQPQLIIYPSTNSSEYPRSWDSNHDQKRIKYRLFSQRSSNDDRNLFRNRQPTLPISNVIHSMSYHSFLDNGFLRFLSRTRNIRKLTLKLNDCSWTDERCRYHWRHKESEQKLKKVIQKIFVLCSKVQKVHIYLSNRDYSNGLPFPFQCLRIAKSLKHLNCSLHTAYFADFRHLVDYLTLANRRGLKHTSSFVFHPVVFYKDERVQHPELVEAQKIIEKIIDLSKSPALKFDLNLNVSSMYKDVISFTEIFSKLQNIVELTIRPKLDHCIPKLLKNFKNPANLTKLSLQLGPSEFLNEYPYYEDSDDYGYYDEDVDDDDSDEFSHEFYYPLDHLVHFISKAKSLTILDLTLKSVSENRSLNNLMDELKECKELSSLSLKFEQCRWVEDSIFTSLIESLENLHKLTDLTLAYRADYFHSKHATSSGMQGFFKSIKGLQNLKAFDLSCNGSSNPASDEDFVVLCGSLKNLKQLERLRISMPNCNIEDEGVSFLSIIIPKFKQLHTFSLNLNTDQDKVISAKGINQLSGSFVKLKSLSGLSLDLKCSHITLSSAELLVADILNMKNLKSLTLDLMTNDDWDRDAKIYLESFSGQLQMKFEASISCSTAKKK